MIENYIRPAYQKILVDPIAQHLTKRTHLTPIHITASAVMSGVLCAVFLLFNLPILASLSLLFSGYLDSLDGTLARMQQRSSAKGAVLDIVADRVVEFTVIFGLFCIDPITRGSAAIWMLGTTLICVTSFLVVGIFTENDGNKGFHYSRGIIERAEAFVFFISMILLPHWFVTLAWTYSGLVLLTAIIRVYQFLRFEYA